MANTWTVNDMAFHALDIFENELVAAKCASRTLEKEFGVKGAQRGDSVRIRRPLQLTVRDGQNWSGQNLEFQYDTLTLTYQKGIDFSMSSKERKVDLDSLTDDIIRPAVVRLANEVDKTILQDVCQAVANTVGTAGTTPNSFQTYLDAGVKLTNQACPRGVRERKLIFNAEMEADALFSAVSYRNDPEKVSRQYSTGELGSVFGFMPMVDQNVYVHTYGTYAGTPKMNGTTASGASSIVTDGWSSGASTLNKGDVITIDDVYDVNPVTKAKLSNLKQFVVTAQISDSSGAMTIAISPSIVGPGSPYQNVDALPANDADINVNGATGTVTTQGLLLHRQAVQLAIVPLENPEGVNNAAMKYDDKSGVGLRYIEWYDGDSDLWKSRFDVVFGLKTPRPEWAVRVNAA